jgi:hypothetical protein
VMCDNLRPRRGSCGIGRRSAVADLSYVLLTVVLFALLALTVRAVEKL